MSDPLPLVPPDSVVVALSPAVVDSVSSEVALVGPVVDGAVVDSDAIPELELELDAEVTPALVPDAADGSELAVPAGLDVASPVEAPLLPPSV